MGRWAKIIVPTILFVIMLVAMTMQKVTSVWCLRILRHPDIDIKTGYAILATFVLAPYLFSLIQLLWNVSFITKPKEKQFPGWTNLFLGLTTSAVEGACVVIFSSVVAPYLPVFLLLPLLNGVFGMTMFVEEILQAKERSMFESKMMSSNLFPMREKPNICPRAIRVILGVVCIILPGLMAAALYFTDNMNGTRALCLGGSIFGLSIVWIPSLQVRTLSTKDGLGSYVKRVNIVYSVVRLFAIITAFGVVMILQHGFDEGMNTLVNIPDAFKDLVDMSILMPLVLNFLLFLLSQAMSYLAVALCLPLAGLVLPSILSTVFAIILSIASFSPYVYFVNETSDFGEMSPQLWSAAMVGAVWCCPYFVKAAEYIQKPILLLVPYETLFLPYGWNGLFFEQKMFLNYSSEGFDRIPESKLFTLKKKSRIFVCTTMYREADYEMERLLLSLQNLSESKKFTNILIEAHIFMDNGCSGQELKEFGKQLIGLILEKLNITLAEACCFETAYGIQLNWRLVGGMPLFVHFKDPKKVKVKKRWSQAMYIHYMMNYRAKLPSKDAKKSHNGSDDAPVNYMTVEEWKENARAIGYPNYTHRKDARGFSHTINSVGYPTMIELQSVVQIEDHAPPDSDDQGFMSTDEQLSTSSGSSQAKESCDSSKRNSTTGEISENITINDKEKLCGITNNGFEPDDSSSESSAIDRETPQRGKRRNSRSSRSSERKKKLEEDHKEKYVDKETSTGSDVYSNSRKMTRIDSERIIAAGNRRIEKDELAPRANVAEKDPWAETEKNAFAISDMNSGFDIEVAELEEEISDDQTYILATDADMEFKDDAVIELLNLCNLDKRLGGACGRTHPIGKKSGLIVYHQIFEYAKDFWMIKNAQNVIGSVMCCPGCFSLYRATAIKQIMQKYSTPTRTPFTVYVKDTGEDRWMATLMMINGWRLRYSAFSHNTTYCPDTFDEFLKQRRRWVLSDIANAILVVQNLFKLMRNNDCFTFTYVTYMMNMFLNNIITPGSAIVMITAGLDLVFFVPYLYTTIPLTIAVFFYCIVCIYGSSRSQTLFTMLLTAVLGIVFFCVVVWGSASIIMGIIHDIMANKLEFQQHYIIIMITMSLAYAAAVHPKESYQIFFGMAYVFIFPAMHILLPIYSIANIIDQSWGTRDTVKAKIPKLKCRFKRKRKKKNGLAETENTASDIVVRDITMMEDGNEDQRAEHDFWEKLRDTLLGTDVNIGLQKAELAEKLRTMRNRCFIGLMTINFLWLLLLSVFYVGISSTLSRLNVYGLISGALYGFTLTIQVIGLTVCRVDMLIRKLAIRVYGDERPIWVSEKD